MKYRSTRKTTFIKTKWGIKEYPIIEDQFGMYTCRGYRGLFTTKKCVTFNTIEDAHYDTFEKFCFEKLSTQGLNRLLKYLGETKQPEFALRFRKSRSEYLI